jgi:hypothetical protein
LVAQAVGRPVPALADGETVKVGRVHGKAMSPTVIRNRDKGQMADVFVARTDGGANGVIGISSWGWGVTGQGLIGVEGVSDWIGVVGSGPQQGVLGRPTVDAGTGVRGESVTGTGWRATRRRALASERIATEGSRCTWMGDVSRWNR